MIVNVAGTKIRLRKPQTMVRGFGQTANGDYCGIVTFVDFHGVNFNKQVFAFVINSSGCIYLHDPEDNMRQVDCLGLNMQDESKYNTTAKVRKILHYQFTHDPHN